MKDHQLRLSLKELFDSNPQLKDKIEEMGINVTNTSPWLL